MKRWGIAATIVVVAVLSVAGCMGRRAPTGFRLPPGDAEAGKAAFVDLSCHACHTVEGVELPPPTDATVVKLGGRSILPRTDGEMTTDIILPSSHYARGYPAHEVMADGKSRMPDYAAKMTVRQLADLVAFLQGDR
ncbi:MAG: c-type cytochrome [Acidobacteria bacterium]|nr:c-type cytochrome [Acidobacteriota bacterium]